MRSISAKLRIPCSEKALQKLVTAFIAAGLVLLALPGTFLGMWNLISISGNRSAHTLSPAWIQAHGQAQIIGWIGTFVIGIGFYSLSKMGRLRPFAVSRGWQSWALWIMGVSLRWMTGIYGWQWRVMLPVSAALQLVVSCYSSGPSGNTSLRLPLAKPNGALRKHGCVWSSPLLWFPLRRCF